MKIIEKSILISFLLMIIFSFLGFNSKCESISNKILRLHILANSDTKEDQELKLKVRDKVLDFSRASVDNFCNKGEAISKLNVDLNIIKNIAEEEIRNQGYNYPVKVELKKTYFTTRRYENFTLPAGQYDAVRILIGEAKGRNWWCVMFPALCLGVSKESSDEKLESILDSKESDIVENESKYEFKFKLVEYFNNIKNWFFKQ